jgi:hypothetical protein
MCLGITRYQQSGQRAHNMPSDMLHTPNTHNMSQTCIAWTQNVFRYHKVSTIGAKGRLREKFTALLLVLTAFNFFGQF